MREPSAIVASRPMLVVTHKVTGSSVRLDRPMEEPGRAMAASPGSRDRVSPSTDSSTEPDRTRNTSSRVMVCGCPVTPGGTSLRQAHNSWLPNAGAASRCSCEQFRCHESERGAPRRHGRKGYVERRPHPDDARARLVVLTEQGWRCARAAEASAVEAVRPWVEILGEERLLALRDELVRLAPSGPIRPSW